MAEQTTMTCPECSAEFPINIKAVISEQSKITSVLKTDNGVLLAQTLGAHITHMQDLIKAVGDSIGGKIEVHVTDIKKTGNDFEIEFFATEVKEPSDD